MTYISLLRGINVSGQKKIIMKDLKSLYVSLGFENVLTYIQSGNVIFESDADEQTLIENIEESIRKMYGFDVPVQVRSASEFQNIVKSCPFTELDLVEEGTRVMVTFLVSVPSREQVEKLMTYVNEPERLVLVGKEVYLHCPNGYGKTKLSNNLLEKKLGVAATTRNWKSVIKLHELLK
jgi:uncharacterized protein (DUF1697 family)